MKLARTGISPESTTKLEQRIDSDSQVIQDVVDALIQQHCSELDNYVDRCKSIVMDLNNPPTTIELDEMALSLPVLMYYTSAAQENLGIKEDVAASIQLEAFNHVYHMTDGTVKDKTAAAGIASTDETLVAIAYSRAYKKIKQRLEYSMEILQSIKKVMSRRISETELARIDTGGSPNV